MQLATHNKKTKFQNQSTWTSENGTFTWIGIDTGTNCIVLKNCKLTRYQKYYH